MDEDAIGGLIGLVLIMVAVVVVVVMVYFLLFYVLLPAGALYGAFTALRNYVQAFASNVRPERVPA